jgi:hypothetical protein
MKNPFLDYETRIDCENHSSVFVDMFNAGIWIQFDIYGGHARAVLTREQALLLVDAIGLALSASEGEE